MLLNWGILETLRVYLSKYQWNWAVSHLAERREFQGPVQNEDLYRQKGVRMRDLYQWFVIAELHSFRPWQGFPVCAAVMHPPANEGDTRDTDSIPGLGRCPGGGNGNPLQYSCLTNPMDGGAWRSAVHRVAKSRPRLSAHAQASVRQTTYQVLVRCFLTDWFNMPRLGEPNYD